MTRVLLACSGLDHARRGFESFARECFGALRCQPGIQIELVKGSGAPEPGERTVRVLRRDHRAALMLARARGVPAFRIEHFAFGLMLGPVIARRRPDVVYLSEWDTARVLARWRQLARLPFKLLLSNGTFVAEGFDHLDRVQELTPAGYEYVIARGADPARHTMLPLGFRIERELVPLGEGARAALRARLELPLEREIVISVAALNRSHKRLDYLIDEISELPEPRPFVLLVGEPDEETPALKRLAAERLGPGGFGFRTVPADDVPGLLQASDVFVLTSIVEAQGRSLIEAMSQGLPCMAHDSPVTRFALGEHGTFGDFRRPGMLASLLRAPRLTGPDAVAARHRFAYERFSWDALAPRYVELLREVAEGSPNSTVSSSSAEKLSRKSR